MNNLTTNQIAASFLLNDKNRKTILTGFFIFCQLISFAQKSSYPVTVSTNVEPPYSPYFNDYFAPEATKWETNLIFNDFNEPEWDVKLRITIESNKVKLQTRSEYIPTTPIRLFPGVPYTITGLDLNPYFQYSNMNVMGVSAADLSRNGKFPEGFYSFCIEVLDYKTGTVLSQRSCSNFWIQLNDEPITITPICGSVVRVNPTQNIMFQWHQSNMMSPNSLGTEYQLTLYEITDPMVNPLNSIQNNKVLKVFESGFLNQNSFLYDMTAPVLDVGKKYVYTIQARDIEGKDLFKNKGTSQPCWFYYGYPINGSISLQQPVNYGSFGPNDPSFFKWNSPTNLLPGQNFTYHLKVVKFDSTQTPEEAMEVNPVWYLQNTVSTHKTGSFDLVIPKKFEPQSNYAWQVTAFSDGQQIAQSPVYSFYGPPVIDKFWAGMHEVQVKSTFNKDLNHLSGVAMVQLSDQGKTQDVPFTNIRIIDVAGRYVLDYGDLITDLADRSPIALTPYVHDNDLAYFYPEKVKLNKESLELYGNVTWAFPHAVTSMEAAHVLTRKGWINYDKYTLSGHAVLDPTNQFVLLEPYQFQLNLFTSSDFLIDGNIYRLRFDGELILPNSIKGTNVASGKVSLPFAQADQLYYLNNNQLKLNNNILPLPNSNIVMAPTSYIIDLSEENSPFKIQENPEWKGVYFPRFRVDFNTDADRFRQLVFAQPIPVNYDLSIDANFKNWIGADGLNFYITKSFSNSDKASFNTFPAVLNLLTLDIQKNSVQNSSLTGTILIPFISTTDTFSFTCPISNTGFQPGYMDKLDGYKFTFNKEGGDQLVNFTIIRAVFADRDRLDMTLDLDWPSLNASVQSLTGFKAWGNYKIGFLFPNGTMALSHQIEGKLSDFPVTFDGIGAGASNGAYAFGLMGKAVLAEDVSGHAGPPAVNIYSTIPNVLLPQTPFVASSDSTDPATVPGNVTENRYEDNVAVIKNDFVKRLSQSSAESSANNNVDLSKRFVSDASPVNYETRDIIEKPKEHKKDSSFVHVSISFNQQALIDEIITAATVTMAQPFTDKITAVIDSQVVKVTSRIDRFRDSLNIKIDRAISRLLDSLALKAAGKLKKDDFDPTAQIQSVADTVGRKLSLEIRGNVSRAIDNNLTHPFRTFFQNEISGRTNSFIEAQVRLILTDLLDGKLSFNTIVNNIADDLPLILHGIGSDAFAMINMSKLENTMAGIGRDAMGGVKVSDIDQLLLMAIDAEASYIISKALSNKASQAVDSLANRILGNDGNVSASAGLGVKMNFENLGRNLKEGRVDKVVRLDAVSVALNTKFVAFGGLIKYTPDDPVYGDTWQGSVKLDVKLPKKFSLQGAYVNGRKGEMPYWFCQIAGMDSTAKIRPGAPLDKSAKKLSSAVPLGPVELVAASGRLYHHMTDAPGRPIVPDENTNYGAGVNFVFFDASSHGTAMRLAVGAEVEIKQDGNYNIDFEGDIEMVLRNPQADKKDGTACGGGGISLNYNSREEHFLGKGWVLFQKGFCAKGNFMVDVKPGYWAVQVGTRDNMIFITPGCIGWGAAGWAGIDQTKANIGLGLSYSVHTRIGLDVGPVGGGINIDAGLAAGVDATVRYKPSIKLMEAGIWVDLWANIGIDYHTAFKSGYINLVSINCKGDLLMTFDPPPTKLSGTVHGHVAILCFGVDFDAGFEKEL